MQNLEGVAIK
jgi:hypothetical protein